MENINLTHFENKEIRKVWHNEQWYFSVVDVIEALTDSNNPNRYWTDLKRRSEKESGQSYAFCVRLNLPRTGGKNYPSDCANTEGVFRIIQSIPSPKAEPIRLWLAEQGRRTIEETENPELITQRQMEVYKAKGYSDEWIKRRMETINTRNLLTDEWKARDVKEGKEYAFLTAVIAKGTFGVTPSEHKDIKGLTKQNDNLRDHMTPLELIFTALGEEMTRQTAIKEDAQGFDENKTAAVRGGQMAGKARATIEAESGSRVVSPENFLPQIKTDDNKQLPE